ncbi:MAG: DUF2339 domain-containing protein, partial [Polyangiales bacterium]
ARPPAQVPAGGQALAALRSLIFGGNTVVRVGVLILIVGVGLLARYAAEHSYFPLELRLAFAAGLGIGLVALGFRQRTARPGFSTALQGGGVATLYLVTFFSYQTYGLLPAGLALALLIAIAALSSLLAVLQDAMQLAVFGAIGGFLAPVLASRGEGNHVALFGYYAVLNAAIAGIALFRSWRLLNWTGFLFTFGIASAWGALKYEPAHRLTAGAFLALFFAFYLLNGTLFALRQPGEKRGTIDTTLTFGTPLATLALAGGLLRDDTVQLAVACTLIAGSYLGVARLLLRRRDDALRSLAQAYVAIGIAAATLAIPLAIEDALATALAWSLEASGLAWVGLTQARLRTRIAGYLLFTGALVSLCVRIDEARPLGAAVFLALIALCFGFASAQLARHSEVARKSEHAVGKVLLGFAVVLWLGALHAVTAPEVVPTWLHDAALLSLTALSLAGLDGIAARIGFGDARAVARFAPAYLLLSLFVSENGDHPFAGFAWIGWALALGASLRVLRRQHETLASRLTQRDVLHATFALLIALVLTLEAHALSADVLVLAEGWIAALTLCAPLLVPLCALAGRPAFPLTACPRAYLAWSSWPIALASCAGALIAHAESPANPTPLPYLPLLNPLDLAHVIALLALLLLARTPQLAAGHARGVAGAVVAVSMLVLLSADVMRTAHHWFGVDFEPWSVPDDAGVQAAFSIVWTALALIAMLLGHRRGLRSAWIAGAVLIAIVVVKLFARDLDRLGSVAKIVSFLVVGLLLLLIGYVAPVPPAARKTEPAP